PGTLRSSATAARRLGAKPDDGRACLLVLLDFDFYCLGSFSLRLGNMYGQNSFLALRTNATRIGVVGQGKSAGERAAETLPAMHSLALLFLVELSFTSDGNRVIVNRDTDVLLLHRRQIGAN